MSVRRCHSCGCSFDESTVQQPPEPKLPETRQFQVQCGPCLGQAAEPFVHTQERRQVERRVFVQMHHERGAAHGGCTTVTVESVALSGNDRPQYVEGYDPAAPRLILDARLGPGFNPTRSQWEAFKRAGDLAFAKWEERFGRIGHGG